MIVLKQSGWKLKSEFFLANLLYSGKWLYLVKVVVFGLERFYSGKKTCIWAKVVVFVQSGCNPAKVVVFVQKWMYSGKRDFIQAKLLCSGKGGSIRAKVIVFRKSCCIRAKLDVFG